MSIHTPSCIDHTFIYNSKWVATSNVMNKHMHNDVLSTNTIYVQVRPPPEKSSEMRIVGDVHGIWDYERKLLYVHNQSLHALSSNGVQVDDLNAGHIYP